MSRHVPEIMSHYYASGLDDLTPRQQVAFDRWLALHDAQVVERAHRTRLPEEFFEALAGLVTQHNKCTWHDRPGTWSCGIPVMTRAEHVAHAAMALFGGVLADGIEGA